MDSITRRIRQRCDWISFIAKVLNRPNRYCVVLLRVCYESIEHSRSKSILANMSLLNMNSFYTIVVEYICCYLQRGTGIICPLVKQCAILPSNRLVSQADYRGNFLSISKRI